MGLENIEIKNFRGIKELKLENLGRINILVGKNNSGKSSVLEACLLLGGMSDPRWLQIIGQNRNFVVNYDTGNAAVFYNYALDNGINIKGVLNSDKRVLEILPDYSNSGFDISGNIQILPPNKHQMTGLLFRFSLGAGTQFQSKISLDRKILNIDPNYIENTIVRFYTTRNIEQRGREFSALIIDKNTSEVVEVLKKIEPRLIDIQLGANNMILADIGLDKLLPTNLLGDGFNSVLAILSMIACQPNSILLIDEIENGLFYEALTTLWTAIYAACEKYNVQVIATTHSLECIQALAPVLEKGANDIKVYRIEREGDQHGLSIIDSESLKNVIDYSGDIR